MTLRLPLLLFFALALTGQAAPEEDPEVRKVVEKLAAGWTFLNAGSLPKAEEAFTEAFETKVGKDRAEVYYSLSAVWWERRNARAAYLWLQDAEAARKQSWYWDGGEDGEWDRRISGRLRYIERNFTVVKLRYPKAGKPLPPVADPPPSDPLLRAFTEAIEGQVAEGVEVGALSDWLLLPNGVYWFGGEEIVLEGGEMEPTRATTWDLDVDRAGARKKYDQRLATIAEEVAAAEAEQQARAQAAQEAWRRGQEGGGGGPTAAVSSAEPSDQATDATAVVARPDGIDPDQKAIRHRLVSYDTTREASTDLSERWRAAAFHASYGVTCPNDDAVHEVDWADADFYVRFEGGDLKVRSSAERLTEKLRGDWVCGKTGELNMVHLYFDGRKLLVVVNGVEFGPVLVRRAKEPAPVGRWEITLTDARAEIQHLWIEPWDGS